MRRNWRSTFALATLLALPVRAQSPDAFEKTQAEALFQEGRALAQAGRCDQAVTKLEASDRLESTPGTLLNLATCYETLGRSASAWVTYRRAASLSRARGQKDREAAARERVAALEPDLSYVKVVVTDPASDLEIAIDGRRIEPAVYGSAFPVDPGQRTLVASRPGHAPWRRSILVPERKGALEIAIPALAPIATQPSAPAAPPPTRPSAPPAPERDAGSNQRTWALVAGGVGLVGFGAAGVFSLLAVDKNDASKAHCDESDPTRCSAKGDALRDDARTYADLATAGTVLGVVGVGAGIVLWLTAPESAPEWSAGIGDRRIWFQKSF